MLRCWKKYSSSRSSSSGRSPVFFCPGLLHLRIQVLISYRKMVNHSQVGIGRSETHPGWWSITPLSLSSVEPTCRASTTTTYDDMNKKNPNLVLLEEWIIFVIPWLESWPTSSVYSVLESRRLSLGNTTSSTCTGQCSVPPHCDGMTKLAWLEKYVKPFLSISTIIYLYLS